jgi:hypothetical protein
MILIFENAIKAMLRFILIGFIALYIFRTLSRLFSHLPNQKNNHSDSEGKRNPPWNESNIQDASFTDIDKEEKK